MGLPVLSLTGTMYHYDAFVEQKINTTEDHKGGLYCLSNTPRENGQLQKYLQGIPVSDLIQSR